jgi:membrane-associated phospholipid phosphatase
MSNEPPQNPSRITIYKTFGKELKEVFLGGIRQLASAKWMLVHLGLILAVIVYLGMPYDRVLLEGLKSHSSGPGTEAVARQISFWGDYLTGIVPLTLLIWLGGVVLQKSQWRRAALALILASSLAGMTANSFRLTLGRPRPAAGLPDGFYGLQKRAKYHGFPSGHAATAFGGATALVMSLPAVGVPCVFLAFTVGWSRMELNRHFPTDILVGGMLGIVSGWAMGHAARRRRPTLLPGVDQSENQGPLPLGKPGPRDSNPPV